MADMKTYCRIFGHVVPIVLHIGNLVYIKWTESPELILEDPKVEIFTRMQPRYLTVWTAVVQVVNAVIGLLYEYLAMSKSEKNYKLYENLSWLKNSLFSAIVWPSTCLVVSTFWSLYFYNRSLVYEEHNDKVVSSLSNHILHTHIIVIALWELIFTPRLEPRSHRKNVFYLTIFYAVYLALVFLTYLQHGIWLYPILAMYYGTIYFTLIYTVIMVLAYTFYFIQWPITNILWSEVAKTKIL